MPVPRPYALHLEQAAVHPGSAAQRFFSAGASSLVVLLFSPFIALKLINARKLLLGIILLELPIQLDVYLGWNEELGQVDTVAGLNISVTTVCLVILYFLWGLDLLSKREKLPRDLFRGAIPMAVYFFAVVLAAITATDVVLGFYEVALLAQAFLLYLYVVGNMRTTKDILFVVNLLMYGMLMQAVIMLIMLQIGETIVIATVRVRIDDGARVAGTIGSPNTAASYLVILLGPALGILLTPLRKAQKLPVLLAFIFGCGALVLTGSRGGWMAFALMTALILFFSWRRGRLSLAIPLVIVAAAASVAGILHQTILHRLVGDDTGAAYSRIPLMELAFKLIKDHPILGVGANNFGETMLNYVTVDLAGEWLHTVHNKYLLVWAEDGIIGLIPFLIMYVVVIRRGWRVWKLNSPVLSPLALGFTTAVLGQMVHMTVDIFNGRPQVQMFWLAAALITAMFNMQTSSQPRHAAVRRPTLSNRRRLQSQHFPPMRPVEQ